ncbi:acetyl-CoA hydrolase/transferase C-terminal domain-containing protein [Marinicella sediminis]|uniref:Acetyl-CoA hydrolase/transferase C-terminal domain-containing protein n=1 Tax=Marinicella sediminis TaxID=1792834 RepID=A0ABV7JHZ8_9GAMM|nr:acetyl-CoA hydrolase/transferase C-terminal domain-containing protein [Marinicella sediminis]
MTVHSTQCSQAIDFITSQIGQNWIVGTPLGIGKPNQLINALYEHAKANNSVNLEIFTALSLEVPHGNSLLERRFLNNFGRRFFGNYPELGYLSDVKHSTVPDNITVREFYMQSGKSLRSRAAQQNYVSSNYTHVARDMVDRQVNVILQMIAVQRDEQGVRYSLSCNPDLTLDILRIAERKGQPKPLVLAMVNEELPFMGGQAEVGAEFFDWICDHPEHYFAPFATPAQPINVTDYSIGLLTSTLIEDGGTLQIGIGSLADALVYSTQMRHQNNTTYQDLLSHSGIIDRHHQLIETCGDTGTFRRGLYAASEMFVEGFAQLFESGILKRQVYPDAQLQQLINEDRFATRIGPGCLQQLLDHQVIDEVITRRTFERLQYLGILKPDLHFAPGVITDASGQTYSADLHNEENLAAIETHCLGTHLLHGAVLHAAFFMGSKRFYQWLHGLDEKQKPLFQMTPVSQINELYGGEALDRVQRIKARFVNTCMKVDVLGAAASDTLDDHQVVSGVGGQYNFVAMAHALEDSRSVLMLRSVHAGKKTVESNIVWKYTYCTIPRHLRDIVVTEYGIADLRGQTDETCIQRMICIADSRFQEGLRSQAVAQQKLSADWEVPQAYRHNTPEMVAQRLAHAQSQGYFPAYPFGEDFTTQEKTIIAALKWLKTHTRNKYAILTTLSKALWVRPSAQEQGHLEWMALHQPNSFKEKLSAKLLVLALRYTRTP